MSSAEARPVIKGRHVLFGLLTFFGVVMAANGALVYFAGESWTGLTSDHSYLEGLHYNETLAAAEAQNALGWKVDVSVGEDTAKTLTVVMRDAEGRPLDDLTVSGSLIRPTSEGSDQTIELTFVGDGRYATGLDLPLKGQWDLDLLAARQGGDRFRVKERLWID
ncbi:MAG: hypothetical protein CMM50_07830 [Rhodospirillaceae bacterium]|nr:hypothetical protein [Rhodospirillaceae bacterium]